MFKKSIVVFLKEMKDLLRDKKTFMLGLLIPLMLLPLMLFIIDYSMNSSQKKSNSEVYISINNTENSFYDFCKAHDDIRIIEHLPDSKSAMDAGFIAAYVTVGENMDDDIINKRDYSLNFDFNTSSLSSMMSTPKIAYYKELYSIIVEYIQKSNYASDVAKLRGLVADKEINEAFIKAYPYQQEQGMNIDTSSLYFNMLVPMMLILYCCIGSSSTASDLSAGEKERGTLEALLSTGANRTSIIIGKLLATTTMGVISGLCTVFGLYVYLIVSSGSSSISLSFFGLLALLTVTLFTAMFFASVNLTIGVYSKSSKEAQTYLMPVSIISLIPTYFTYTLDINSIKIEYLCIPIMNIVCIIKEIFAGAIDTLHIGIVIGWLLLYVMIAFSLTAYMFKKENVIFRI